MGEAIVFILFLAVLLLALPIVALVIMAKLIGEIRGLSGEIKILKHRIEQTQYSLSRLNVPTPSPEKPPVKPSVAVPPTVAPVAPAVPAPSAPAPVSVPPVVAPVAAAAPSPAPEPLSAQTEAGKNRDHDPFKQWNVKPQNAAVPLPPETASATPPAPDRTTTYTEDAVKAFKDFRSRPETNAATADQRDSFEAKTQSVIEGMWNWLVVGEEYRPKNVAMEYAVATVWLVRGAALLLIAGIAYFLKYTHDHNYLTPQIRVLIVAALGLGGIVFGGRMAGKTYRGQGLGLVGIGIAILFSDVFAAFRLYNLIPQAAAFGLMFLLATGSAVLALRHRAQLIAMIGLVGGFAAPLLLDTGSKNHPGLFTYLALLLFGVLVLSIRVHWKPTQWLAMVGSYVLYFGALNRSYVPVEDFPVAIGFAGLFFLLINAIHFAGPLRHRATFTVPDLTGIVLNTVVATGQGIHLVKGVMGTEAAAFVPLAVAAFFVVVGRLTWRGNGDGGDRQPLRAVIMAQVATLVAVAAGLFFSGHHITLFWAMQAVAMLWLSRWFASKPLFAYAILLYLGVILRVFFFDIHLGGHLFRGNAADYLAGARFRLATLGMLSASLLAGVLLLRRPLSPVQAGLRSAFATFAPVFMVVALLVLFLYSSVETHYCLAAHAPGFTRGGLSLVWGLWGFGLVWQGLVRRMKTARMIGLFLFVVTGLKVFFVDLGHLDTIYRVAALVGLGVVMLAGAFLYTRFARHVGGPSDKADAPTEGNGLP